MPIVSGNFTAVDCRVVLPRLQRVPQLLHRLMIRLLDIRYITLNPFAFQSGYSTWLFTRNAQNMTCCTMALSKIFVYWATMVFMDTNSQWYSVRDKDADSYLSVSQSGYLLAGGTFSICEWWCRCNVIQIDGQWLIRIITRVQMIASGMQTVHAHTIGTNDLCLIIGCN